MIRYAKNLQNVFRGGLQLTPVLLAGILPMASALSIAGDKFADTGTDTYKEENLIDQKYAKNTFTGRYSDTYKEENLIDQKYAKNTFTVKDEPIIAKSEEEIKVTEEKLAKQRDF